MLTPFKNIELTSRSSYVDVIAILLLLSTAFFVYSNTLDAPFIFDDIPNIV